MNAERVRASMPFLLRGNRCREIWNGLSKWCDDIDENFNIIVEYLSPLDVTFCEPSEAYESPTFGIWHDRITAVLQAAQLQPIWIGSLTNSDNQLIVDDLREPRMPDLGFGPCTDLAHQNHTRLQCKNQRKSKMLAAEQLATPDAPVGFVVKSKLSIKCV